MKTILVDDDQDVLDVLREYLQHDSPEVKIVGEARRLSEARHLLAGKQPDLVLLDIHMEEEQKANVTSFELIGELQEQGKLTFDVIFVTAHPRREYMQLAIDYSPVKFITKPISRPELRNAIQKALKRLHEREAFSQEMEQMQQVENKELSVSFGAIACPRPGGELKMIKLEDILYISSFREGTMTEIHLSGKEKPVVCTFPIGHFRKLLTPKLYFFQIHQSYIINLKVLDGYYHPERTVKLNNGEILYAAVREGRKLREYLLSGGQKPVEEKTDEKEKLNWVWRLMGKGK